MPERGGSLPAPVSRGLASRSLRLLLVAACLALVAAAGPSPAAASTATEVGLRLAQVQAAAGGLSIGLDVSLAGAAGVLGVEFAVTYDPAVFDQAAASFVPNGRFLDSGFTLVTTSTGRILVAASTRSDARGLDFGSLPARLGTLFLKLRENPPAGSVTEVSITMTDIVNSGFLNLAAVSPPVGRAVLDLGSLPLVFSPVWPTPGGETGDARPLLAWVAASPGDAPPVVEEVGLRGGGLAGQAGVTYLGRLNGLDLARPPEPLAPGAYTLSVRAAGADGSTAGQAQWEFSLGGQAEAGQLQSLAAISLTAPASSAEPLRFELDGAAGVLWTLRSRPPAGHPLIPGLSGDLAAASPAIRTAWPAAGRLPVPSASYRLQAVAILAAGGAGGGEEFTIDLGETPVSDYPLRLGRPRLSGPPGGQVGPGRDIAVSTTLFNLGLSSRDALALVVISGTDGRIWFSAGQSLLVPSTSLPQSVTLGGRLDSSMPPGDYRIQVMAWSGWPAAGGFPLAAAVEAPLSLSL